MTFVLKEEIFCEISLFLKSIQESLLFLNKGKAQKELLGHLCRMSWVLQYSCSLLDWEHFSGQLVQFHAFLLQIREEKIECSLEIISFLLETLELVEQGVLAEKKSFVLPTSWEQKMFFLSEFSGEQCGNLLTP